MDSLHKKNTFMTKIFGSFEIICTFASSYEMGHAQMAESVDALVSNTSGFTSIPVRPRVWVPKSKAKD